MIKYHVRSRDLITVINEIKAGRLILDAYFQRNLVWREIHKQDFIKTILLGFPCPQIFISRGAIDVVKMETTSCVVDGQQRLSAIKSYIEGDFLVDGRSYSDLSGDEKSDFLKYELAVIELDLDNNDNRIKDIFQRLNRTSNSLTAIEKIASQYAPSEFMLVATYLAGELEFPSDDDSEERFRIDPEVDRNFFDWAASHSVSNITSLYQDFSIFRSHELSRKVHLMHILNLMTTMLVGFFNRNEKSRICLEDYAQTFAEKEEISNALDQAAAVVISMDLSVGSYWLNKANVFSLLYAISVPLRQGKTVDANILRSELDAFEKELPSSYRIAAAEGVNDVRERKIRHEALSKLVGTATPKMGSGSIV
ncbi:GmrSD restriction endonuclease domain-containing protein [Dyella mobilis]|uniref:DUF262 domain-containing protein n=1 Tax=Dyella mobilis TaxID=1849582 RepID=A0ABS2KMG5_9GAMM|nr:DUF262 domain-containing protein [Dyella mobilis]MBM7132284.1 DUF262 domain-containing protein [Dyella mobilis]GLQ95729.1 hypothetical protein GCM10007863_01470 [Dyella mobilis]